MVENKNEKSQSLLRQLGMTVTDYTRKNFYWCVFWGFVFQCVGGCVTAMSHSLPITAIGWSIYLVGTVLLSIGFGFYVRSKGRSLAWSVLALISIIGWVILILLKDKNLFILETGKPPKLPGMFE